MSESTKAEINTTRRWGIGIFLAIVTQSVAVIWYFAHVDSAVAQNTKDIQELQNGSSVYISREQLNDLLGARDEKTLNIEKSLLRIELKLDKVIY